MDHPSSGTPLARRGAYAALFLLLAINLFNYLDRQVLSAVVPQLKATYLTGESAHSVAPLLEWFQRVLGFRPENALMGILSMAFMVTYMAFSPLLAFAPARLSRWWIVGFGVILWSLASGASGHATTFLGLLLTRCLVGVGEAAYGPVAPALIADLFPVERRGRMLSIFYLATPVGSALGYVWGEQAAHSNWGVTLGGWTGLATEGWRWAFYLLVPPGILLGLLAFLRRDPRQEGTVPAEPKPPLKETLRVLRRSRSYVWCTLGMCAMTFAIGGIGFWMPDYLTHKPGAGSSPVTVFGAIIIASGLVGTLAGGWLADRLRTRFPGSYLGVSGVAMFTGMPLILGAVLAPFPYAWYCLAGACICLFFNTGPTNAVLANVVPRPLRTAGYALNIFFIHALGDVISPVIIGLVGDRFGMTTALSSISLIFMVAGLCWLRGMRSLQADTRAAEMANEGGRG